MVARGRHGEHEGGIEDILELQSFADSKRKRRKRAIYHLLTKPVYLRLKGAIGPRSR
jgi:hypothetical protein